MGDGTQETLEAFLMESLAAGCEGLVVKVRVMGGYNVRTRRRDNNASDSRDPRPKFDAFFWDTDGCERCEHRGGGGVLAGHNSCGKRLGHGIDSE